MLTAIRQAKVVPLENLVFAVLKVGLLLGALAAGLNGAIALSWMVATGVLVLAVTGWLTLRALPRFGRAHEAAAVPIDPGSLTRFVRADYAGAVCQQAALLGMPVLVLARLGADRNATYGIVWQVAQTLFVVSSAMNQSMVAHTAASPGEAETARRAAARRSLMLVVPGALLLTVFAFPVLSVFGRDYADDGGLTLALTALAAIPNVVNSSTVSAARVQQRGWVQFAVPACVAAIVIPTAWMLMPVAGIVGVGIAWLVGQSVVALAILVATAPWLPPQLTAGIDAVRTAALTRRVGNAPELLRAVPDGSSWTVREQITGGSESVVLGIGPSEGEGALLKASETPRSRQSLAWQTEVLGRLHEDERVAHLRRLFPVVLSAGEVGRSYCVIESRMPGESGIAALRDPRRTTGFVGSALEAIGEFHSCTGDVQVVGEPQLQAWVHAPLEDLTPILPRALLPEARSMGELLVAGLRGKRVSVGWTHGDFGPVNLLAGETGRVTAIVDWCDAQPAGLQILDVVGMLQFSVVHGGKGAELGPLVLEWAAEPPAWVRETLERSQHELGGDVVDPRLLNLLGWLKHVSDVARKSRRSAANPVWNRRNVRAPLRACRPLLQDGSGQLAVKGLLGPA